MRIEAYSQVQQVYTTKKTNKAEAKRNVSFSDHLQLSSIGKDIQSAKAAVAASSDVRESVTAPLKARIQAGSYEVSADSFAEKLFSKLSYTLLSVPRTSIRFSIKLATKLPHFFVFAE